MNETYDLKPTQVYDDNDLNEINNEIYDYFNKNKTDVDKLIYLSKLLKDKINEFKDVNTQLQGLYALVWCDVDRWCERNLTGADKNKYLRATD